MVGLDVWGALAASFLLLQCLVLNLIFVALAAALFFGSRWGRKNAAVGLNRAGDYLNRGRALVEQGEARLVMPFVRTRARLAGLRAAQNRLLPLDPLDEE